MGQTSMPVLRQVRPNLGNATLWRRLRAYWREPVVYELAEACEVELPGIVGYDDAGKIVLLPRGFRCDLASTPRLAWLCGLRPDAPCLLLPGIVHDFYYRYGYFLSPSGGMLCAGYGRLYADKLLAALVHTYTGLRLPALTVYAAVRACGCPAWRHNARYRAGSGAAALQGDYTD